MLALRYFTLMFSLVAIMAGTAWGGTGLQITCCDDCDTLTNCDYPRFEDGESWPDPLCGEKDFCDGDSTCGTVCCDPLGGPRTDAVCISGGSDVCTVSAPKEPCAAAMEECVFTCDSYCGGEPHFRTWSGKWYDFHGECDLVLVHSTNFAQGLGLDVHIRTKIRYDYSYIASATLKIGDDVLEVTSFGDYFINGVGGAEMPAKLAHFPVSHASVSANEHLYEVKIGNGQGIVVKTLKDFVAVKFKNAGPSNFSDSKGLLGEFGTGRMLARDGKTLLEGDPNSFGQEWQVLHSEPKLFQYNRPPQHPHQECILPSSKAMEGRRLGETVARDATEKACAHFREEPEAEQACVYDVMATGDLDMARAGAF